MAIYYNDSGLTWQDYLQQQSFVDDITESIHKTGVSLRSTIDNQTSSIVATIEDLENGFSYGLNQLDNTIQIGFDRLEYSLEEISTGISALRASFDWALSRLIQKVSIQNLLLQDIFEELRIPDFQKERRYYVEKACEHYQNGLYEESLQNFLKAEPLEKTDAFVLYSIGHFYLYHSEFINLIKAQDYFARAAKYYIAQKQTIEGGLSFFHAGIASYLRKDGVNAVDFTDKAIKLFPELYEAFYNHAKFLAALADSSGLPSLETAIKHDRNYAIKALADGDFRLISEQFRNLMDKFRKEAKEKCDEIKSEIDAAYLYTPNRYYEASFVEWRKLLDKAFELYSHDTYFGYLDCLALLEQSQPYYSESVKAAKEKAERGVNEMRIFLRRIDIDYPPNFFTDMEISHLSNLFERASSEFEKDKYLDSIKCLDIVEEARKYINSLMVNQEERWASN